MKTIVKLNQIKSLNKLTVAIFTQYPRKEAGTKGGVQAVSVALVDLLNRVKNLHVSVITIDENINVIEKENVNGVDVYRLPRSSWPQMLDIFSGPNRRQIIKLIEKINPDIVHFHETHGLTINTLKVPKIFTVHGFDHANVITDRKRFAKARSVAWKYIQKLGFSRQKYIISINPYVRSMVEPQTQAKIFDIENPVDPLCFEVQRDPLPGRIFSAGWISNRKNPLVIVRAVAKLLEKGINVEARFAGESKDKRYLTELETEIKKLSVQNNVIFLGRLSHREILDELSKTQVFALLSLQENAPMAISEALSVGVPVITSNRCGMPYMVRDGENGFVIEPHDSNGLADRLERLLTQPELNNTMGHKAREIAFQTYHPESVANKTLQAYFEVIKEETGQDFDL